MIIFKGLELSSALACRSAAPELAPGALRCSVVQQHITGRNHIVWVCLKAILCLYSQLALYKLCLA